jgi:hypothetical protein
MQQQVMTRDAIDAVPTDKTFANLAVLKPPNEPAARKDTGGSTGQSMAAHPPCHRGSSVKHIGLLAW